MRTGSVEVPFRESVLKESIVRNESTIHSDDGPSMQSQAGTTNVIAPARH